MLFLSTLSLRRATSSDIKKTCKALISIHALLAESDNGHEQAPYRVAISIHALLAESDIDKRCKFSWNNGFLSTLSLRRATRLPTALRTPHQNFYPRSPCGERRPASVTPAASRNFYPRSPCGERHLGAWKSCNVRDFYPRSPCGERPSSTVIVILIKNFYPRSPCGERQRT